MKQGTGQDMVRDKPAVRAVAAARNAYQRSATAVEFALNSATASTSQTAADLRVLARGTHAALLDLSENGLAAAQAMQERLRAAGDDGLGAVAAASDRNRVELRDLMLRSLAAVDTNNRAAFDCLETMARAGSAQEAVAAQVAFVQEQTQRSLQQAIELQQAAADLLQSATAPFNFPRKT